jgi:hypothetical protein
MTRVVPRSMVAFSFFIVIHPTGGSPLAATAARVRFRNSYSGLSLNMPVPIEWHTWRNASCARGERASRVVIHGNPPHVNRD